MTDAAQFYLEDQLRRHQPDVLLTRIFMPRQLHLAISAQFVLLDELTQLLKIRETGVAMTKMTWWFEEWQRLEGGEPRHPVTRSLRQARAASSGQNLDRWPKLDSALSVVASIIQGEAPADVTELHEWLKDFAAPLIALERRIQPKTQPTTENSDASDNVVLTWQKVVMLHWLSSLERLAELGRAPWPLDLTARTQIRRPQLRDSQVRPKAAHALWSAVSAQSATTTPDAPGHAGVYLSVASQTVLASALGRPQAGRWRSLFTAWQARRRC